MSEPELFSSIINREVLKDKRVIQLGQQLAAAIKPDCDLSRHTTLHDKLEEATEQAALAALKKHKGEFVELRGHLPTEIEISAMKKLAVNAVETEFHLRDLDMQICKAGRKR